MDITKMMKVDMVGSEGGEKISRYERFRTLSMLRFWLFGGLHRGRE